MALLQEERLSVPANRLEQATRWVEKDLPPEIALAVNSSLWLAQVDTFREAEEAALGKGEYEAKLKIHRVALMRLIDLGEHLVAAAEAVGLPKRFREFQIEDLRATLEGLHTTFRCEHKSDVHPSIRVSFEAFVNG